MLRITRTALLVLMCLSLSHCKKDKQKEVIIEYPLFFVNNMKIDTTESDSLIVRESIDFPTNLDGELAKNNTDKSKIKSGKLEFFRIQILDNAVYDSLNYCNFKDLKEMSIDIKHTDLGQFEVANKLNIPDIRTKAINLDMKDVELKDFLQKESFRMVFKYKKRRQMHHEMPFVVSLKFKIVADAL